MERLSSCYFCGAALDASLSEYPVVPKDLRPETADRDTVVLCPTCRRKLANVVGRVVDAVDEDVSAATPAGSESEADGFEWRDEGDAESATEGAAAATAPDQTIDAERSADAGADDERAAAADAASESGTDAPTDSTDAGEQSRADAGQTDRTAGRDEPTDADDDTDDDEDPQMTALEYNKVMRLLQNRDLPVEKAEIRTVATNAYQISDEEFEAVIDAATSRGLINEENGQFVAAE